MTLCGRLAGARESVGPHGRAAIEPALREIQRRGLAHRPVALVEQKRRCRARRAAPLSAWSCTRRPSRSSSARPRVVIPGTFSGRLVSTGAVASLDVGQLGREDHEPAAFVVGDAARRDRRRDEHRALDFGMKLRDPTGEDAARAESDDDDRVAEAARDLGRRVREPRQLIAPHAADGTEWR